MKLNGTLAIMACSAFGLGFLNTATEAGASSVRGKQIVLQSDLVTVSYRQQSGNMDVTWKDGSRLAGIGSAVQLEDGKKYASADYSLHELVPSAGGQSPMGAGGHEYTVRNTRPGSPDLLQHIWLYDGKPWIVVQAELGPEAAQVGTRHFDAVLAGADAVKIDSNADLRVLHVPFDNDMWFRFESRQLAAIKPDERFSSEEVTAVYDNTSRRGMVLGSITHDVWKTAIDIHAADSRLSSLDIYGGISSPTGIRSDTHDVLPHGLVRGERVLSPAIFIGSFSDWRDGLEAYGKVNAQVHPPLAWADGAPMGWNSWAAYADKVNERRYLGAAQFLRDRLLPQGFERNKVVYINFDAFWSNLDAVQLEDAVANIEAMHGPDGVRFEPGIYWTPFAYWSDDLDAYVEGTGMKYRYRDILLKGPDGAFLPKVDGGRPIDPSHPGTKARTDYYMTRFQQLGFKYLKLDFLSHGTLEGMHYDKAIQTGTEAYNEGMQQVIDANGNRMFLSLSIAPLFPSGYGHARRLSCDTKGHISGGDQSTEYMLNSLTYGWWTDKNLYIADPDHVVLGDKADQGARNVVEGRSRLLSAVISGGMILDSTRLADDPQGQEIAKAVYSNRNLFAVAAQGGAFRPVEGKSGNQAADAFVRRSPHGYYLALFNYDEKQPRVIHVPLERIAPELAKASAVSVKNIDAGGQLAQAQKEVVIELAPSESRLVELSVAP